MRVYLYERVSTEEQKKYGLSIQTQKDALRAYVDQHGYTVIGEYTDEGFSARKNIKYRPALARLLSDLERDKPDTILFTKLDRWSRNIACYYEIQKTLDRLNVKWNAILEDYETETSNGQFLVNVMLSVNQQEADRTGERIKFIFDGKRQRGEVLSGNCALGICIRDKHYAPDEATAGLVRELFQEYINTRSQRQVMQKAVLIANKTYSTNGIKYFLQNPLYADLGIVDRATFDSVQQILHSRQQRTVTAGRVFLFTGLMRCPECGSSMKSKCTHNTFYYTCAKHNAYGSSGCPCGTYYREDNIEAWLLENIEKQAVEVNKQMPQKKRKTVDRAKIESKLRRLQDIYIDGTISKEDYNRRYQDLQKQLESIPAPVKVNAEVFHNLSSIYQRLDKPHRKAFWSNAVKSITPSENGFKVVFVLPYQQ